MFITAMAANPLAVNLAAEAIGSTISWGTWAMAGIVPGLFALLTMPLLMYIIYPPEKKDTPDAPALAKQQLDKLGPMSTAEKITAGAFLVTVALWIFGGSFGINAVAAALVGLTVLLVTGAPPPRLRSLLCGTLVSRAMGTLSAQCVVFDGNLA